MKRLLFLAPLLLFGAVAGAQGNQTPDDLYVTINGADNPEAFPIEGVAANFFGGLADMEREHPGGGKRHLENTVGLSPEGAQKLVDVATEEQTQRPAPRARAKELCNDLRKAQTREEFIAALRSSDAQDLAQGSLQGAKMLSSLEPKDRAKVMNFLDKEVRPSMTRSSLNHERMLTRWPPEQFREHVCDVAHQGE